MFGNASSTQDHMDYNENTTIKQPEQMACITNVSIPKVESCYSSVSNFNEDTSNTNEILTSPIPFTTPYKVKDPIVLLEKCDKIWETLKLIKDVQSSKSFDSFEDLSSEITNSESLYIKYQPVLGNDNTALPNFKFSIKTTKKLFHCSTCGKLYADNRTLRFHSERVHGIYIPPKRYNRNSIVIHNKIDKSKESNDVQTEKSNFEKLELKKNENELLTDSLLQSVAPHLTECKIASVPNFQSQRKKKNILIHTSSNLDSCETIRKEPEKETTHKELEQSGETPALQHDSVLQQQCILCKQLVQNIREHLTDYHKIECPDLMLKELEKTSAAPTIKELNKISVEKEPLRSDGIIQDKHSLHYQKKGKQKLNMSHIDPSKRPKIDSINNHYKVHGTLKNGARQCDICFGIYSIHSYAKHMRNHRVRGETKENFHLFSCNYWKSPLCMRQKVTVNSNNISSENTNNCKYNDKDNSNLFTNEGTQKYKKPIRTYMNRNRHETTCSCGRSFRNPHTLYIHKSKCNLPNSKIEQSTTNSKLNNSDLSAMRNSCDRDSGIGISITIKKKNNSYEVVGKDIGDENKLQDFSNSKDTNVLSDISDDDTVVDSQDQQYGILDSSKYSENHSILRIQFVDEDIDVDIEEDSQYNPCNNNISDKLTIDEVTNDFNKEEEKQITNIEQNKTCHAVSKFSCKEIFAKEKHKKCNDSNVNSVTKNNSCICGNVFNSKKALDIHIDKHHRSTQLICGYCKETFVSIVAWDNHQCYIKQGDSYVHPLFEISCHYCSTVLNSYSKFDEHIKLKHFDPVVPYQCFQCHKRFSNTTSRKLHFDADHSVPTCSTCNKKCSNTMKFRHEAYHYGLGFPCHLCKKAYCSNFILSRHKTKVHPKKNNMEKCEFCHLQFASSKALKIHKKNNKICKKSFRNLLKTNMESGDKAIN
ncbi:uncharacterized protein LOC143149260 [Ptiloglossa arizonensis]|uniref:uncharacterized protein LOC143149260 n=1 Tax=Ptiloglossa arizonensis TaxID=3350558 RepID=UPI003F9F380F